MSTDDLRESLAGLATEQRDERYADLDLLSTAELVAAMNEVNAAVPAAVAAASDSIVRAVDGIAERMSRGGRLFYVGAGTPGRLGILDASEAPPTFGTPPGLVVGIIAGGDAAIRTAVEGAEDDEEAGRAAIAEHVIAASDSVVGLSASGRSPFVVAAVAEARSRGAFTVGAACNTGSELSAAAEVGIETVVGPEIVQGSTRLKAGTAQKLVLNMLSTLAMVRLGKTYGNLMVDVQATNEKLVVRSERIVVTATGASHAEAAAALAGAGGSVKTAILMILAGVGAPEAERRLAATDGHLRAALAAASA